MAVQKYGSMRTEGCTEIWNHEKGRLYITMEALGGMAAQNYGSMRWMAVQKYRSMRRDGCTEIWKHDK